MQYMSKNTIKNILYAGNSEIYSHVLICKDYNSDEIFPRFVKFSEDLEEIINNINKYHLQYIYEIYNYNLNIEEQLHEGRSYHTEKYIQDKINESKIELAIKYATRMHEGQTRKDGTAYITHPIRVANYVRYYYKDKNFLNLLLMCAYLHDTIEDTLAEFSDIIYLFGMHTASIIDELTTNEQLKNKVGKERYLEIKMTNMSTLALIIKLCDRLDNISDLEQSKEEFKNRYSNETIGILEFVLSHRKLSNIHLDIMKEIAKRLQKLNMDDSHIIRNDNIIKKIDSIRLLKTKDH